MLTVSYSRFTLMDNPRFVLDIEYTEELVFLHVHTIRVFNKSVLKELIQVSDNLAELFIPKYGALYTYAKKDRKDLAKLAVYMKYSVFVTQGDDVIYRRLKCQ